MQALSPLSRCAEICGLSAQELIVGGSPRPEHELLAARYFRSSAVRKATMRHAMVNAIRAALRASQTRSAADLLIALRMMLGSRRARTGAPRRRSRRWVHESRRPVQGVLADRREKREATNAVIINFADRQATRASSRASG